jgi:uncharacterized protein YktA (UPF0223 family)
MKLNKKELNNLLSIDQKVVDKIIEIHRSLEHHFDIFGAQNGKTVSYIVLVRSLSLLTVINDLLKSGKSSEAQVYFRTVHESNALSLYFIFSHFKNENTRQIEAWFAKHVNLDLKGIRKYLADISSIPEEYLETLFGDYSKLLHHTYRSIMECYKYFADFSPLKAEEKREGFEYKQAPFFGDNIYEEYIEIVHQYQNLIQLTLMTFHIGFHKVQGILNKEGIDFIEENIEHYSSPLKTKLQILETT